MPNDDDDHANDLCDTVSVVQTVTSKKSSMYPKQNHPSMLFPTKLHKMLSQIERDGFDHIISWQPHGRCFVIHQPDEFQAFVLPRYFDTRKIASFQRQLGLYGFTRLAKGRDKGGYFHELFLRGKPSLVDGIVRRSVKGKGTRTKANSIDEPNFWVMSWVGVQEDTVSTTVFSPRPTQITETQPLMFPNNMPTSPMFAGTSNTSYSTSVPKMSSAGGGVNDGYRKDFVSLFASRNIHPQSRKPDVESSLQDCMEDDDCISVLRCLAES